MPGKDCGVYLKRTSHELTEKMFGAPERINADEVKYFVSVKQEEAVGIRFLLQNGTLIPNLDHQERLLELKHAVLMKLVNHTDMFKKPPTLEYLQAITPNWGCIVQDNAPQWSPYTILSISTGEAQQPCFVDLILTGLYISRSRISPHFETVFVETYQEQKIIDIEWSPDSCPPAPEVEEISEISFPSAGTMELRDPATLAKLKQEAKLAVKAAFQKATVVRDEALELAKKYTNDFEISDNESMFSEWLENGSDSEAEQNS